MTSVLVENCIQEMMSMRKMNREEAKLEIRRHIYDDDYINTILRIKNTPDKKRRRKK